MTDLISSLADSILALINSKPQSPTKAEIEEVARTVMSASETITRDQVGNLYYGGICFGWGGLSNDIVAAAVEDQKKMVMTSCLMPGEHTWGAFPPPHCSGSAGVNAPAEARCIYCGEKPKP